MNEFTAPLQKGEVRVLGRAVDERLLKLSLIKFAPPADAVLMASSRGLLVQEKMFPSPCRFLNLSVPNGSIPEFVAFWEAVKLTGHLPKTLIIFLDPWSFNANGELGDQSWLFKTGLLEQFKIEHGVIPTMKAKLSNEWKRWSEFESRFFDLFTWSNFTASVKIYDEQGGPERDPYQVVSEGQVPEGKASFAYDGSYSDPKNMSPISQQEIEQRARTEPSRMDDPQFKNYKQDPELFNLLMVLAWDALWKGTEVHFVIPPLHDVTRNRLNKLSWTKMILPDFESVLNLIHARNPGIVICNLLDASLAGCAPSEFLDGLHMNRDCAAKVIKKCF